MDFRDLESAYFEKSMLEKLDHPNILKMIAFYESSSQITIATEMMTYDLRKLLEKFSAPL